MRRYLVSLVLVAACASCTRPSPDPPGVGEQPKQHPERNPATQPTAPGPANAISPSASPENPDQLGTTRTPPAPAAAPMDDAEDAGPGSRVAEAGTKQ
jgi:hypothetical protein